MFIEGKVGAESFADCIYHWNAPALAAVRDVAVVAASISYVVRGAAWRGAAWLYVVPVNLITSKAKRDVPICLKSRPREKIEWLPSDPGGNVAKY